MAFTTTTSSNTVFGNKRIVFGTFTNDTGSVGGEVATGLTTVDFFMAVSSAGPSATQVNETLPLASGTVTIVNTPDDTGFWMAIGDGLV